MRRFLIKLAIFTALAIAVIVPMLSFGGGYVDYFYPKVAAPRHASMITGDSRGMYGVRPEIINKKLKGKFDLPMLNYSFFISQAMYGELYTESVQKKLIPDTKNGLFILTVNPWMFLKREGDDFAKGEFFEAGKPPHNLVFSSVPLNPEHFFKNFEYAHYSTLLTKAGKTHDDGWFQDNNIPSDKASLTNLGNTQLKLYKSWVDRFDVANYRVQKFNEMVGLLEKHGTVVLVRMPSSKEIVALERELRPGFDVEMQRIANQNGAHYLNYTQLSGTFSTFDKVHLDPRASIAFTELLCDSVYRITKPK